MKPRYITALASARADYASEAERLDQELGAGWISPEAFFRELREADADFCRRARWEARDAVAGWEEE